MTSALESLGHPSFWFAIRWMQQTGQVRSQQCTLLSKWDNINLLRKSWLRSTLGYAIIWHIYEHVKMGMSLGANAHIWTNIWGGGGVCSCRDPSSCLKFSVSTNFVFFSSSTYTYMHHTRIHIDEHQTSYKLIRIVNVIQMYQTITTIIIKKCY